MGSEALPDLAVATQLGLQCVLGSEWERKRLAARGLHTGALN